LKSKCGRSFAERWEHVQVTVMLRGVRVFIASPGGLDTERSSFRRVISDFNEDDGYERGVSFIPVGWELARPGIGRPQEKINEDVRRSDYVVLVLGDRWGSPPSAGGTYTSGTEEEYNVARECIAEPTAPMRDILVLFKGVDPKQLSDPGPQLKRVLAFKKQLEKEKSLLFQTFDTKEEFERHLRRQLLVWARDEGDKVDGSTKPPSPVAPDGVDAEGGDLEPGDDLVAAADALAKAGRFVEAESLYARAVVGRRDLDALTKYVRFLRRTGRLDQAFSLSRRLLELADEEGVWNARVEALSNMAIVERKLGRLQESKRHLLEAVASAESAGPEGAKDLAFLLDNIGLTERKEGNFDEALRLHLKAIEVREKIDDPRGMANALNHTGSLMRQSGRYREAELMHRKALDLFVGQDYPRGQTQALANLGEDLLSVDRLDEADETLQESLRINRELQSPEGIGMNLWQLGRLALKRGDLPLARQLATEAIVADDSSGRPEGIAGATHLLGQVQIAEGAYSEALTSLETANDTYLEGSHKLGQAWTLLDMAKALLRAGDESGAREKFAEVRAVGSGLSHAELSQELERLAGELAAQDST
jgi:tetratricopeptide (TPR) repeat protein